ncbi:hypothetical protein O181_053103 [Austropuccinia psidii MF-1]|uniref:Uncharacterized protein n=1 Tax=Austropuccinia psidii MF-1 TaxID=1389203 RepID=A0A9Q3E6S7_9BASI|nr:hypothetical protein [Austropuccinia psidii MF-1]
MAGDELNESLPVVHEENSTRCHHPYASKLSTGHASSSTEKDVNDEDENMSLTQSETNCEPRRENFMVHEEGTRANSELTHPQMPITQSMLNQSEMRQQRNQAGKADIVAKSASHKDQQRWVKAELPDNVHGMGSAVHTHLLFLLKAQDKNFSSLLAPLSTEEHEFALQVSCNLRYVLNYVFNKPSTQVQYQGCQSYCENEPYKLELNQLTWDWENLWQNPLHKLIYMVFYHNFQLALVSTGYHHYCWNKDHNNYGAVAPVWSNISLL